MQLKFVSKVTKATIVGCFIQIVLNALVAEHYTTFKFVLNVSYG